MPNMDNLVILRVSSQHLRKAKKRIWRSVGIIAVMFYCVLLWEWYAKVTPPDMTLMVIMLMAAFLSVIMALATFMATRWYARSSVIIGPDRLMYNNAASVKVLFWEEARQLSIAEDKNGRFWILQAGSRGNKRLKIPKDGFPDLKSVLVSKGASA